MTEVRITDESGEFRHLRDIQCEVVRLAVRHYGSQKLAARHLRIDQKTVARRLRGDGALHPRAIDESNVVPAAPVRGPSMTRDVVRQESRLCACGYQPTHTAEEHDVLFKRFERGRKR